MLDIVKQVASLLAPTTVLAALLYYYGYVTTASRYLYFGIDVEALRLSRQELALRSVGAIYPPLVALLTAAVLGVWAHGWVHRVLPDTRYRRALRYGAWATFAAGCVLFVRGIVGMLVPEIAVSEPLATTPLCLGAGALLAAYGRSLLAATSGTGRRSGTAGWVLVSGLMVLSLFWVANSFAGAYGTGQAQVDASSLADRPSVVVDTRERLYVDMDGVLETSLPVDEEQTFRYRYRGLQLLTVAGQRLFLVSDSWGERQVLVLPDDGAVRLRFISAPD